MPANLLLVWRLRDNGWALVLGVTLLSTVVPKRANRVPHARARRSHGIGRDRYRAFRRGRVQQILGRR